MLGGHSVPSRHLIVGKAVPSPPASGLAGRLLAPYTLHLTQKRHDACVD